jgi:hypothetical protein
MAAIATGSRLTLGDELRVPGSTVLHEGCFERFQQARGAEEGD